MIKKAHFISLSLLVLVACTGPGQFLLNKPWAEKTLSQLTLREKIAQMMIFRMNMRFLNTESRTWKEIESLVDTDGIGGVHIWFGDAGTSMTLLNEMQKRSKIPILVDGDIESGLGRRYPSGIDLPPLMAIAATGDPHHAYEAGRIAAEESRAVGIHFNLSPVVDVNNNPKNPIINTRAFGEDPDSVSRYALEYIRGIQAHGMLATAKHFPGHGDTETDSHSFLAQIPSDSARLWSIELPPFQSAIQAGVDAIMVAHVNAPDYQPNADEPATLSSFWVQDILRNQLGFQGAIITDAMSMGGVTNKYSDDYALIETIKAGADIIIQNNQFKKSVDVVERAVKTGLISEERINEAALKMLQLKEKIGLNKNRYISSQNTRFALGKQSNRKIAEAIGEKAVTLVKNEMGLFPLNPELKDTLYLIDLYDYNFNHKPSTLTNILKRNGRPAKLYQVDKSDSTIVWKHILSQIPKEGLVFLNLFANTSPNKDEIFLPEGELVFVQELLAQCPRVVVTSFGSPYLIQAFPEASTYLCAYKSSDIMQKGAAKAYTGKSDISGFLPVTIPGVAKRGHGIEVKTNPWENQTSSWNRGLTLKRVMPYEIEADISSVTRLMAEAVEDSAWPGGVLLACKNGKVFIHHAQGTHTYGKFELTRKSDIFDLASITKVIATTSAAMKLVEKKALDLDAPVVKYLPEFKGDQPEHFEQKQKITLRHLLTHTAGLPPFRHYYNIKGQASVHLDSLLNTEPEIGLVEATKYSDVGLITLGKVIEKVSGLSLEVLTDSLIFSPLGMSTTLFNPPAEKMKRIVPTEYSTETGTYVRGLVHDENARSFNGVAGHAGLFSTAQDLAIFSQMMLNDGLYGWTRIFKPETVDLFTQKANLVEGSSRCLGWDSPAGEASGGVYLSDESFGHTGFTGTSLWIDPVNDMFVILLTNAVHPHRSYKKPKYYDWRQRIHSAVYEAVGVTERNNNLNWRPRWE